MLAFVAAERREFDGLLRRVDRLSKLDWPLKFAAMAWIRGEPVVLAANGPGPVLAGRAVEIAGEHEDLKALVSTGYCGALNPALEPCDIFVATEMLGVAQALRVPRARPCERCKTGKLLSVDHVVSTMAEKAELRNTGADVVEMEAAGVASKAALYNIPFYCVRVVTDTAVESFPLDFNQMRDRQGRFNRGKIFAAAVRRPRLFPALMNLNKRSHDASRVLGDFLVDASF